MRPSVAEFLVVLMALAMSPGLEAGKTLKILGALGLVGGAAGAGALGGVLIGSHHRPHYHHKPIEHVKHVHLHPVYHLHHHEELHPVHHVHHVSSKGWDDDHHGWDAGWW